MARNCSVHYILERINIPGTFVIDKPGTTYICGRARNNDIVCLSLTVSREHCSFFFNSEDLFATDFKSSNGMFINGHRQTPYKTVQLQPNDIIGIGCDDVNVQDNTMFVYRLRKITPAALNGYVDCGNDNSHDYRNINENNISAINGTNNSNNDSDSNVNKKNNSNNNDLSRAVQNIDYVSLAGPSTDKFDALYKRKRDRNNDERNTVPSKIPKLSADKVGEISLEGDRTATDENDIEIVHISLNNNVAEQSNNNCDSTPKRTESDNKLNTSKVTDIDMFEASHGEKDKLASPENYKTVCDKPVSSKKVQSLVSGGTSNDKKEENFVNVNKNVEYSNQNMLRDGERPSESNLSNVKDKENSHNSCNIPPEIRKKESRKKGKVTKENTNSALKNSLKSFTELYNDLDRVENDTAENLPPPSNLIHDGDTTIKLEDELQLTDTDEEAILNSSGTNFVSLVSPLKLKPVQQEPKTEYSQVDIVNLSDSEDDIFPCSQLFDIGFGMDTSVKEEVKKESVESDDRAFSTLDDADSVISLSDSEDEDNPWLRRLSQSQLLNENDETVIQNEDYKKELLVEEITDIEDTLCMLNRVEDELLSTADPKDKVIEEKEEEDRTLQNVHKADKIHVSHLDTEDDGINLDMFTSPINYEKSTSSKIQNLDPKGLSTFGNNALQETMECESSISLGKMRKSLQKKVPEIEPPHLPTRRRSRSSTVAKEVPEKPATKKLSAKEQKELKEKEKLDKYRYVKEQKNRRQLNKWADCLPPRNKKPSTTITEEKKKEIVDNRKLKLKRLAVVEKRLSLDDNQEKKRIPTKAVAKVSTKTRSDVLLEDTLSASKSTAMNTSPTLKTAECKKIKDSLKEKSACPRNSSTPSGLNISSLGRIPKKNNVTKEKANTAVETSSEDSVLVKATKELNNDKKEIETKNKSSIKSPKATNVESSSYYESNLKKSSRQRKKRVSFSTVIQTVHEYEIDESNILRKLAKKDAPIARAKIYGKGKENMQKEKKDTKVDEFLHRIFSWNPVWLEEQEKFGTTPPIIGQNEYHVTLTHYRSYDEYCKLTMPLLLLETWSGISKEYQNMKTDSRRRTLMYSVVENSIQINMVCPNMYFSTLMIEILVSKKDLHKQVYPCVKDLVVFEYVKNHDKGQSFRKAFAYITNMYQTQLTPMTHYNKDLKNYLEDPHMLITYTLLTKSLENNFLANRVQRLRVVYKLRSTIRQVEAVEYLPKSPIANLILNPKAEMYHLPPVSLSQPLITNDKLNQKQLEAVCKITEMVVQKQPKICFIQGPPGTGKSKVIVNIITQVLYGNERYTNFGGPLRILVCAPSNAAVDELTLRLLKIRSTIKHKRFKMVRIGRVEIMHPDVRDISLTELTKRDLKKTMVTSPNMSSDSVEQEKSLIESKMNALRCEITNTRNLDEAYKKHLQMKLSDLKAKYKLLNYHIPLSETPSKENMKLDRYTEDRVLAHADIITCTLASCFNRQMESVFTSKSNEISVCIVDEATQSCEAETLIPLRLGIKTLVLVGDPMQLPATVLSTQAKKLGLNQSIFARVQSAFEMNQNNPIIMLDTQYRMQHDIALWPNKFFYGSKLKTAVAQNEEFPFYPYRMLNINTNQNSNNNSNADEAHFVANMIFSMLTYSNLDKLESLTLGILTPYNDQKSVIQKKVSDKMALLPENIHEKVKFEVNTVDGFQGQERDVIIMSCVRSQKIGFLSDRQRLCVALTRAKHSLILCGNFNFFMKDEMWRTLISDARNRKVYFNVEANTEPQRIIHVIKRTTKR